MRRADRPVVERGVEFLLATVRPDGSWPIATDLATLKALHRAHLLAIPYENLDVQMGRRRTTSPAEAYEKIVGEKRGGWCYEMNGTFGWALKEAGFKVTRLAGAGGPCSSDRR